jgi:HTH-type transcriptional regulator/antitoxin HigA
MEGVLMMDITQLHTFIVHEALQDIAVEQPGDIYEELCRAFPLRRIKKKENHASALKILTKLSELMREAEIGSKEKKQILVYMDALGLLAEEYEKKVFAVNLEDVSGAETLEFLMEQHSLKQSDLAKELGSQSVVSEILSGKRKLSSHQIIALSERFGVSPSAFFP